MVPLHHVKNKCFIPAACVDINFQLSSPAKSVCMASRVKLPVQNMNFRPSPPPNPGKMPIRVDALAFDLFVLNYHSHVPNSSLSSKYTGKRVTASLIVELVKLVSGLELLSKSSCCCCSSTECTQNTVISFITQGRYLAKL